MKRLVVCVVCGIIVSYGVIVTHWRVPVHNCRISSVALSKDKKHLAFARYIREEVYLWDVDTEQQVRVIQAATSGDAFGLAFTPDNKLLLTAGGKERGKATRIREWDVSTGTEVKRDHSFHGFRMVLSDNGNWLATIDDRAAYLFDYRTGREHRAILPKSPKTGRIVTVSICKESSWLVTGETGDSREVCVWDIHTGKLVHCLTLTQETASEQFEVAMSEDGKQIVAFDGGDVVLKDLSSDKVPRRFAWPQSFPEEATEEILVAITRDRKVLACRGNNVKVWHAETGDEVFGFNEGGGAMTFSSDDKWLRSEEHTSNSSH